MTAIFIFGAAAALILYITAGYPLLVAFLSRGEGRAVRKGPFQTTVSVLLPVRNGEKWIRQKLESILALDYQRDLLEIIVISDGSTDETASIVKSFLPAGVQLLELPPGGKAAALTAGMHVACGNIFFFTDVRQWLAPDSLKQLVQCFRDPSVGVASGELIIMDGVTLAEARVGLYWKFEKWIRSALSRIDSIYGATGCIYAMRRELAVDIPRGILVDDVYLPLAAFFRGYRVILDSTAKAYDFPTQLHSEFRRKLRTQTGMLQVIRHYPELLGPRNRMWFHFVSHKLGRLLLPWLMLTVLISGFWLPGILAWVAVGPQLMFYSLALLDIVAPERTLLKRVTSLVSTFVVLLASALCAPFMLFRSPETIWRQTKVASARTSVI